MLTTRLTERLNIEHPVLLGGMSSATNVDLVVAVSEAGGLGILGVTNYTPEQIREAAAQIRDQTDKPFGLNLLIAFTSEAQLDACLEVRVPVLSTAWGNPERHAAGARHAEVSWVHMVRTAADAAEAARLGATAIVAQGHEGGGHIGLVSAMPLVPAAVDAVARAVSDRSARPPVVAAGGVADGRGLVAALALGAEAVLLGTRFLATNEAPIHEAAKRAIVAASEADTIAGIIPDQVSNRRWTEIGALARSLRTRAVLDWVGREDELRRLPEDERRSLATKWSKARNEGRIDETSLLAGEDSGLIHDIVPAGEVVRRIVAEAEEVLRTLPRTDRR